MVLIYASSTQTSVLAQVYLIIYDIVTNIDLCGNSFQPKIAPSAIRSCQLLWI